LEVRYFAEVDLRELWSRTRVEFRCLSPGVSTFVDLVVPAVESLAFNGQRLPTGAWRDGRVELPPLEESNLLEVSAAVRLGDSSERGLVSFEDTGGERFAYTYGRTDGVARWAPCFLDVPAGWNLRVVAPEGWTVLSHGPPQPASTDGVWEFVPPFPLPDGPTFAAGPWARIEGSGGVPLWSRPSVGGVLAQSPAGEFLSSALAHHAAVLDVPYPYETRDCVFIPSYGSQAGCSGGLVLCHERVLHASVDDEWHRYVRWVLAHEIAHSWFGGLVGFSDDAHRWTAEGLATYLCHRANGSWDRFHVLEELEAQRDDIAGRLDAPSLIYAKPAAVVRHLESVIGTEIVEAGLTSWLREHAGGSSTGDELVDAWSQASGRDLHPWANSWINTPGVNRLVFDRATGTIHQYGTPLREHHITIQTFDAELVLQAPVDVVVTGETTAIPTDVADAEVVVLNAPARTYAIAELDERSRRALSTRLGDLPDAARAACWVAALHMVKDGRMPAAELSAWVDAFASNEPDPQIRDLLRGAVPA